MNNLTQPLNRPVSAPPYHSFLGWEFEKDLEYRRLRLKLRDTKCVGMMQKCVELEEAAIAANDVVMFYKYHAIWLRCFEWRLQIAGKERAL
jgi:hypothetical protein